MDEFYKFTIDDGIKYFKESHFGVPNPTDKDIKDLDGWQFLSTLYTVIHLCERKAKKHEHIYICDPEGSCSDMDKKPDVSFNYESKGKDPDFNLAVKFSIQDYEINWLEKYKNKTPSGKSVYGFYFGSCNLSSALGMTFYFE
tara:strand:+ start:210 stop:635 length:426 start_codon:yes stop_codon:yes gene_type:complete